MAEGIMNAMTNGQRVCGYAVALAAVLLATGCATTSPGATFQKPVAEGRRVDASDTTSVKVEAGSGVSIQDYEKQRLAANIQDKISLRKAKYTGSADPRQYEVQTLVTRYDKGNAFARAMLAGLGQIHVDTHVTVLALPEREKVAEFDVNKTFAWGGIYGGSTTVEDVEHGLADGIAQAVTGVQDN
jgi:hypothetical protein